MTIIDDEHGLDLDQLEGGPLPLDELQRLPFRYASASGTYAIRRPSFSPRVAPPAEAAAEPDEADAALGDPPIAFAPLRLREELRLDVDRHHPQMTASGTSISLLSRQKSWIARVRKTGTWRYAGPIWHTDGYGAAGFAYDHVDITVVPSFFGVGGHATVVFSRGGGRTLTRRYPFESASFRAVQFEFDATPDAEPITQIETHDHPNRPATLADEALSIETVFRRAGFAVTTTPAGTVPVSGAGANGTWSDAEMHDAMQTYWSRFADAPQWALWTFWARQHDTGRSLGGVMFDDIGPNHRQGTAIFTDSFIRDVPAGDAAPDAWDRRMRFWTAVHEMGHAFNLAHSWQKALGTPWIPMANQPEARSFMNYPYFVSGGQAAFFSDFAYRFSDEELLFLRHAPSRFVQMGNADWFDHHSFEQAFAELPPAEYRLEVRANRPAPVFEFLEPVVLELKLTNTSAEPKVVHADILDPQHVLTIVAGSRTEPRQWMPYARTCTGSIASVLEPRGSVYASLPVFAGLNGWDVSEPGSYDVVAVVEVDGRPLRSEPFSLRVAAPRSPEESALAGEVFTERVGRALAFDGTAVDTVAADTLAEAVDRLPASRIAIHAAAAIARPLARDYKLLEIPDGADAQSSVSAAGGEVRVRAAQVDEALQIAEAQLVTDAAAETLGHIRMHGLVDAISGDAAREGAADHAASMQRGMRDVLEGRGVLPRVLDDVARTAEGYAPEPKAAARKPATRKPAAKKGAK
ncbi:hypothetical protein [Microbacterium hominis]|uniref:Uncharacterized protein n=1 Tax=Microbacterium hominis TaxID=162426 RepID=A0A7D4PZK8_9MICO|nr:hypothetical protein [Microbacterium hominis]QKJ18178.1 hypothetical protein HQM25_01300 [Microbacterium hominis]